MDTAAYNGDRSEPEDEPELLSEVERGRIIDRERAAARECQLNELDEELKRTGQALDLKAAFARCLSSGSSGNEDLKGGGPTSL